MVLKDICRASKYGFLPIFVLMVPFILTQVASGNPIVPYVFEPNVPIMSAIMTTMIFNLPLNLGIVLIVLNIYCKKDACSNIILNKHSRLIHLLLIVLGLSIVGAFVDLILVFGNVQTSYVKEGGFYIFDYNPNPILWTVGLIVIFAIYYFSFLFLIKPLKKVALYIGTLITSINFLSWIMISIVLNEAFSFSNLVITIYFTLAYLLLAGLVIRPYRSIEGKRRIVDRNILGTGIVMAILIGISIGGYMLFNQNKPSYFIYEDSDMRNSYQTEWIEKTPNNDYVLLIKSGGTEPPNWGSSINRVYFEIYERRDQNIESITNGSHLVSTIYGKPISDTDMYSFHDSNHDGLVNVGDFFILKSVDHVDDDGTPSSGPIKKGDCCFELKLRNEKLFETVVK